MSRCGHTLPATDGPTSPDTVKAKGLPTAMWEVIRTRGISIEVTSQGGQA